MDDNASSQVNPDELSQCPKCGFQQPTDQYCAKCGIDMHKFAQKRKKSSATVVVGGITLSLALATLAYTKFHNGKTTTDNDRLIVAQAASSAKENTTVSTRSSQTLNQVASSSEIINERASAAIPSAAPLSATIPGAVRGNKAQHTLKADAPTSAKESLQKAEAHALSKETTTQESNKLQVTFAWAEVSHELLQALGANNVGFHRVQNLEARLKDARSAYRVLNVTRQNLKDDSEPVTLSRADLSFYFEPISVRPSELAAGYSARFREIQPPPNDGSSSRAPRAPASATVSLSLEAGAIVNMGPSANNPSAANIVIFVMPRWKTN